MWIVLSEATVFLLPIVYVQHSITRFFCRSYFRHDRKNCTLLATVSTCQRLKREKLCVCEYSARALTQPPDHLCLAYCTFCVTRVAVGQIGHGILNIQFLLSSSSCLSFVTFPTNHFHFFATSPFLPPFFHSALPPFPPSHSHTPCPCKY